MSLNTVIPRGKIIAYFCNKLKMGLQKRLKVITFLFFPLILKLVQELTMKRYFYTYYISKNMIYIFPKYLIFFTTITSIRPALLKFNIGSTSTNPMFFNVQGVKSLVNMYPNVSYIFETRFGFLAGKDLLKYNTGGKLIFYFQ